MDILVSGSLAYDRIMSFPGRYEDHIMPDQLNNINVAFMVDGYSENFGRHRRQHCLRAVAAGRTAPASWQQ